MVWGNGAFGRSRNGAWRELRGGPQQWTDHEAIRRHDTNRLSVRAVGDAITVAVNDVELGTLNDDTFAEGYVGYYAASSRSASDPFTRARFDNAGVAPLPLAGRRRVVDGGNTAALTGTAVASAMRGGRYTHGSWRGDPPATERASDAIESGMRHALSLLCCLLLATVGCAAEPPGGIVLVVIDTLRADHMSLYGYERETTPRIDELSTSGSVFEHAYSASSWTLPGMASILPGLYPNAHGAGTSAHRRLREGVITLPQYLSGAGYETSAVVNVSFLDPIFGMATGFDHYDLKQADGDRAAPRRRESRRQPGVARRTRLVAAILPPAAPVRRTPSVQRS